MHLYSYLSNMLNSLQLIHPFTPTHTHSHTHTGTRNVRLKKRPKKVTKTSTHTHTWQWAIMQCAGLTIRCNLPKDTWACRQEEPLCLPSHSQSPHDFQTTGNYPVNWLIIQRLHLYHKWPSGRGTHALPLICHHVFTFCPETLAESCSRLD